MIWMTNRALPPCLKSYLTEVINILSQKLHYVNAYYNNYGISASDFTRVTGYNKDMNEALTKKLKTLPAEPGVYFHKSTSGEIIYVGKAASLKNRVRQYFQASRLRDLKTDALVAEIADTDWITVETELDALFLESEMIKRYKPRYNILLRDDKSQLYVRIPLQDAYPSVTFTRGPLDDDDSLVWARSLRASCICRT